jgi:hypothetical protein
MTDKEKEIVQALRCCADNSCSAKCPAFHTGLDCRENMHKEVLALLERLTAENVVLPDGQASAIESLLKEIEWKDMVIALAQRKQAEAEAERDAALADLADARSCKTCKYACDTRDCSSCRDETCKCRNCGLDKHAWEWRSISGMPVLPNEGGLSWAPGSLGAEGEQQKNEPLTLQELVELNGQPVWMGEPFNKWARFEIGSKNLQDITPEMKIRKGFMNVNGEIVEIPPVNFYRKPIKEMPEAPEGETK